MVRVEHRCDDEGERFKYLVTDWPPLEHMHCWKSIVKKITKRIPARIVTGTTTWQDVTFDYRCTVYFVSLFHYARILEKMNPVERFTLDGLNFLNIHLGFNTVIGVDESLTNLPFNTPFK